MTCTFTPLADCLLRGGKRTLYTLTPTPITDSLLKSEHLLLQLPPSLTVY